MRGGEGAEPLCCHRRVAEGVEHYLDLLAALHSDPVHTVKHVYNIYI